MSDLQLAMPHRFLGAASFRSDVTTALTRALMVEWARTGYAALSLEAVARRAGTGKAALYRRWPSKLAMVSDALSQLARDGSALPDRGSFEADLAGALRELRRLLRHPQVRRILPDLHAEMPRSPELARLVRERVQAPRRARLMELIERAVIRRELPAGSDAGLAADMILGTLYWRMVATGGSADDAFLDALAASIAAAFSGGRRA